MLALPVSMTVVGALCGLGAALMRTPIAPSMRFAVAGAAYRIFGATLMQTLLAPSMRFAVVGAASC
jgi:hypothetical protein